MRNNRSHLIPTKTVDKNGVVTTRHRKPDSGTISQRELPKATIEPAKEEPALHLEQLITLLQETKMKAGHEEAIRLLHDYDKTATPLLVSLLSTGTDVARSEARKAVKETIDDLIMTNWMAVYSQKWTGIKAIAWAKDIKHAAVSSWHAATVAEATGSEVEFDQLVDRMTTLDEFLHPLSTMGDRSNESVYWRGLAAAAISDVSVTETNRRDAFTFPVWAGSHENLSGIISVSAERQTLNAEAIAGIMEEQSQTATPLRPGTL